MAIDDAYSGLEPAELWRHFAALNAIPRPSGHEERARNYVREVVEGVGGDWHTDRRGNAVARVPPRGCEGGQSVAIQTHLDMVCESAANVVYDAARDEIVPRRDGDRISAEGTTLGADNGIGVAAALAVLTQPTVLHGPLELVFTVEEETGLRGALAFDASQLRSTALVNLDSENPEAVTIGSAGGANVLLNIPIEYERVPRGYRGAHLRISGLRGGHSGIDIHRRRANAIELATDILEQLDTAGVELRFGGMDGGSAHNAIPREAIVRLAMPASNDVVATETVAARAHVLRQEWAADDPGLTIELRDVDVPSLVAGDGVLRRLVDLLRAVPHGVIAMSERFAGTVETSANLALVRTNSGQVEILTSARSLSAAILREVESQIAALATAAGAKAEFAGGYPTWQPRDDSPLLRVTQAAYRDIYRREPRLDVVHGGLECGVIVHKNPEIDAVSFGPLIVDAHTPNEHVYASTVVTTWRLLVVLLEALAKTTNVPPPAGNRVGITVAPSSDGAT